MTCYTALITPFDKKGVLDEEGLRSNLALQRDSEVDGLAIFGTTGEAPTLSTAEKKRLLILAKEECPSLSLMAGCGSASTTQTLENIQFAADYGSDLALVVTPFYNKPTQEGLFRHYEFLSKHTPLPLIVYNVRGRTSVHLEIETLKRISDLPNVIGVKESTGVVNVAEECIFHIKRHRSDFLVFSGDDRLTLPLMALGSDGVISVVSNLFPSLIKELLTHCQQHDFVSAREVHYRLLPLFEAAFWETNPIPIKAAMQLCGLAAGEPRLPLTPLSQKYLDPLKGVLEPLLCVNSL